MRQFIFIIISLLLSMAVYSQGTISGKITDSSFKKPKALATITVFRAVDTSIVTYRLSNSDGEFKIPGLPLNIPLRFIVSFAGSSVYRKDFKLTATDNQIRFDSIALATSDNQLDNVVVMAERPPVMIKQDTIEFNASAFKTLPNALVEDLLKKLPGVEVDADGNITVNGKVVNRILVDGKTFFGDDPKMATRNLPANIIDKVQVTDDKEQLLRNGDDNINNVGKVVNITLKKGVKKGMFGKVYAGAGTDNRFESGGIANIFRDTLQVSVLGYANNLNRPGFSFSELLQSGGLSRNSGTSGSTRINTFTNGRGSGITINGVNFGGAQNYGGIATSSGTGININHAPNNKQSIFAQYFYGHVNIDRTNKTDINQNVGDTVISNHTLLTGPIITNAHNFGIGTRLKPDSLTNILFTANYTIGLTDENKNSVITSTNNKLGQLSNGNILQENKGATHYYKHGISYTKLSKTKKGRRFTFNHNLDINDRSNDNSTDSRTHFIYPSSSDSVLQQLRMETLPRTDATVGINYSEPLNKSFTIRMGGSYEYSKLNNGISTFNPNNLTAKYDVLNTSLSSDFKRTSNRFYLNTGLEYKLKDVVITPAFKLLWQHVNNNLATLSSPIIQNQSNILPALTIAYKQFGFNYNKDIVLPGYNYLIPVSDNSNPYFVAKGNPNLLPAERHNLSVNYYLSNPKKNLNFSIYTGANFTDNDVLQSININNQGIQTSTPVNTNGSESIYINYNISRQYKNNAKFTFAWNTGAYYSYDRNKLLYNGESSWQKTYFVNQWSGIKLNWHDKFEWNTNYSINYNFTSYTSTAFKTLDIFSHNASTEFIVRMPKHLIWETSANYTYNGSIPAGSPKDLLLWNAALNITMLKGEKGVLRLSVYDILNKNNNTYVSVRGNVFTALQTNVLAQYFMATFTYNIRPTLGEKKKLGGDRLLMF